MSDYFKYFPNVKYDGKVLVDITRRTDTIEKFQYAPFTYLPYTIEDGFRPEDVAYHYYGNVRYTWLLFYANDIIDPYYDWPLSHNDLMKTIGMKYRGDYFDLYANTLPYESKWDVPIEEVLEWTMNATVNNNIIEYRSHANSDFRVSKDTFSVNWGPDNVVGDFYAWRIYDEEVQQNENKRQIFVISSDFADKVLSDHKELMNE